MLSCNPGMLVLDDQWIKYVGFFGLFTLIPVDMPLLLMLEIDRAISCEHHAVGFFIFEIRFLVRSEGPVRTTRLRQCLRWSMSATQVSL